MFPTNQGPRIPLPQPRERGCEDFAWDAQKSGELIALRDGAAHFSGGSEPRRRREFDPLDMSPTVATASAGTILGQCGRDVA